MELDEVRQKMEKAKQFLADELASLKTGRANASLVERIMVEAYNSRFPLVELATISTAGPSQILITPFDQAIIEAISKALSLDRGLGLQPVIDGNVIRINIPPLNEERRQELVKILHQKLESGRVMIRQVRHDQMADLKRKAEAKEIDEDSRSRQEEVLQKLTDEFNAKIEEIGKAKEQELLSI